MGVVVQGCGRGGGWSERAHKKTAFSHDYALNAQGCDRSMRAPPP